MTNLESNLREILSQKETKIIPENIKKGVTIFGIVGGLDPYRYEKVIVDILMGGTDYSRLNYIESSGTQYIDTLVKAKSSLYVEMKFNQTNNNNRYQCLFGGRERLNTGSYGVYNNTSQIFIDYGTSSSFNVSPNYIGIDTILTLDNNKLTLNNDNGSTEYLATENTFSYTNNLFLFGMNHIDTETVDLTNMKLYYCIIYDTDTNEMLRYFVPAKKISTNEIGLYDVLNSVFYTNSGSGSFTSGGDYNG